MSKVTVMKLLADRPVAYHPDIARIVGGVKAAVFLCQLLYWTGKGKRQDGFIWKTQAEMEEETALTRYEQEGARKKLLSLGILEEKRAGVPAKMHYRVCTDALTKALDDFYRTQECGKVANKDAEKPQTITESTTESTTENNPSGQNTPTSFQGWLTAIKESKNRPAVLRWMVWELYPDKYETEDDVPSYAYLGKVAKKVGGAGRLADLLWQHSTRPPTGDVLAFVQAVAKGKKGTKEPYAGIKEWVAEQEVPP